jgi:hypothetical protein
LCELLGQDIGDLNSLAFDDQPADSDIIVADRAGGKRAIAVLNLPRRAVLFFERARLGRIEDTVVLVRRQNLRR